MDIVEFSKTLMLNYTARQKYGDRKFWHEIQHESESIYTFYDLISDLDYSY